MSRRRRHAGPPVQGPPAPPAANRPRPRPCESAGTRRRCGNVPSRPAPGGRGPLGGRAADPCLRRAARRWSDRSGARAGVRSPDHSRKGVDHEDVEHREDQQTVGQRDVDEQPEFEGALEGGLMVQVVLGLDAGRSRPAMSLAFLVVHVAQLVLRLGQQGLTAGRGWSTSKCRQKCRGPAKKCFRPPARRNPRCSCCPWP